MDFTIGDLIRIVLCQRLAQKDICNVFVYLVTTLVGDVTLEDAIDEFKTKIIDAINAVQNTGVTNVQVIADNLSDDIHFYQENLTGGGVLTTGRESNFEALSIQLVRGTKTTRNGWKRIGGIDQSLEAGANTWDTTATAITDLETALADVMNVNPPAPGSGSIWAPVILGRNPDGSYDLTRYQGIVTASARENKGSQVSRKV